MWKHLKCCDNILNINCIIYTIVTKSFTKLTCKDNRTMFLNGRFFHLESKNGKGNIIADLTVCLRWYIEKFKFFFGEEISFWQVSFTEDVSWKPVMTRDRGERSTIQNQSLETIDLIKLQIKKKVPQLKCSKSWMKSKFLKFALALMQNTAKYHSLKNFWNVKWWRIPRIGWKCTLSSQLHLDGSSAWVPPGPQWKVWG